MNRVKFALSVRAGVILISLLISAVTFAGCNTQEQSVQPTSVAASVTPQAAPTADEAVVRPSPVDSGDQLHYGLGEPSARFSAANRIPPQDVLEEVQLSLGGGGQTTAVCKESDQYPEPIIDYGDSVMQIDITESQRGVYFYGTLGVTSCGWNEDEVVNVIVEFPDGRTVSDTATRFFDDLSGMWYVQWDYDLYPSDPQGEYRVILRNKSYQTSVTSNIVMPTGPHLYLLTDISDDGQWLSSSIFLYGFQPNENVRLFAYDMALSVDNLDALVGSLIGWDEFTVYQDGTLSVWDDVRTDLYAAVGDITGEVRADRSPIKESILR